MRLTEVAICILTPVVICVAAPMGGAVTVATICRSEAGVGVEKLAGVPRFRLVEPADRGVNVAVALLEPAGKLKEELTVPINGAELLNGTETVPIAGFKVEYVRMARVVGLRIAGRTVMEVGAEKVVVEKLPGE